MPCFKIAILALLVCLCTHSHAVQEATVKSLFEQGTEGEKKSENIDQNALNASEATTVASKSGENLEIEPLPFDQYQRMTPKSSMQGYLKATSSFDYALATNYLDYRNLRPELKAIAPEVLAEQLSLIFDRTVWIDVNSLSQNPEGNKNESVPSYRDLVAEIETSRGSIQILLQHVPDEKNENRIWKISNATVSEIPFLVEEFRYNAIGEWLYLHLPKVKFLNVMMWQWIYFLGSFLGFVLLSVVITRVSTLLIRRFRPQTPTEVLRFINGPICLLLAIILSRALHDESNVTIAVAAIGEASTILLVAWTWVFLRSVDLIKQRLAERFIAQDKPQAVFLLRPASTVTKTFIVITITLLWFENLGFHATTLLAGLGIGGLAVALAAQKTVENIIGAITLYTSAPVKIGDLCKFGAKFGVIEEIGLRATRIRTLDRSVIYVPNAKFVDMELENISEREKIVFRPKLMLSEKTQQPDLASFMKACKQLLDEHEKIDNDPCRVRFKGFTPWALEVDVLCYVVTTDFAQYMEIVEELNLAILGLLNEHNCQLANPEFARVSG